MPVLRLFAAAREAAGTAVCEVPGSTVDDVLDRARSEFGAEFSSVLDSCQVWLNGSPCEGRDPVDDGDEVAALPPVSGGSEPPRRPRPAFSPAEPPRAPRTGPPRRSPGAEEAEARRTARRDAERSRPGGRPAPDGDDARGSRPRPRPDDAPARRADSTGARRRPPSARPQPASRQGEPQTPTGRRGASGPRITTRDGRPVGDRVPRPKPVDAAPRPTRTPTPPPLQPGVLTRTAAVTGTPLPAPEADDNTTTKAGVLTRMGSVGVPVTGAITVRGKERKVSGRRQNKTEVGRRYAVVYDTDGPKVTLGVLWFLGGIAATYAGWWSVTFLYAIVAGFAGMEAAQRWRERGVAADQWIAGMGAAAIAAAAASGAGAMGGAILLVVVATIVRLAINPVGREHAVSAAGNTVGCAVPFGLAAGSVVLTWDLEILALVILLLFVAAYEAGDFLIGSGASNSIEGPATGVVTIFAVAAAVAVARITPFEGASVFTFAAFAAVACPLGQLAASAILPASDAHAPSVRRLDSLLLLGPIWVWSVGVFMAS